MTVQQSLRGHLGLGLAAVAVLMFVIFGWGTLSEISGAVIAPGKLVVDSNVKKVQHPTGGVVGTLNVKDGDRVKKGDIVVRLDETQARTSLAIVTKALDEMDSRQARLVAERDGADKVTFPDELLARRNEPEVAQATASEQRLFELRRSAREGQKAQLLEQVDQLRQQILGNDEQVAAKSKEIDWNRQELDGIRGLWKQNLVPFNRVTTLERDSARLHGERGALTASIAQAKGRMAEIQLKILQIDEDLRTEVGKELAEIRGKRSELTERRVAAEDQLKRIDLVAPQDGRVFQQAVHTVGGVIQAGEVLMLVVPDADELIIEAKVAPQDVDQIHVGQLAVVQFAAFNRRTTPEMNGEVIGIGADITQDDRRNEAYYAVRIRISDKEMARLEGLQPMAGMPVEVFIKTSPRTVVSYLTKPLREQIDRAFRGALTASSGQANEVVAGEWPASLLGVRTVVAAVRTGIALDGVEARIVHRQNEACVREARAVADDKDVAGLELRATLLRCVELGRIHQPARGPGIVDERRYEDLSLERHVDLQLAAGLVDDEADEARAP